jgi:hypothetical protein
MIKGMNQETMQEGAFNRKKTEVENLVQVYLNTFTLNSTRSLFLLECATGLQFPLSPVQCILRAPPIRSCFAFVSYWLNVLLFPDPVMKDEALGVIG